MSDDPLDLKYNHISPISDSRLALGNSTPKNSSFANQALPTSPDVFEGVVITKQSTSDLQSYQPLSPSKKQNNSPAAKAALGLAATLTKALQENAALNDHALTPRSIRYNSFLMDNNIASSQRASPHPSSESFDDFAMDPDDLLDMDDTSNKVDKEYQQQWDSLSDIVTDRNLHYIRKQKVHFPDAVSDVPVSMASQCRYSSYVSMLEDMFGPGDINRGEGRKPRNACYLSMIFLLPLSILQYKRKNTAIKSKSKKVIKIAPASSEEGGSSRTSERD